MVCFNSGSKLRLQIQMTEKKESVEQQKDQQRSVHQPQSLEKQRPESHLVGPRGFSLSFSSPAPPKKKT
jgi:hypothetical protein